MRPVPRETRRLPDVRLLPLATALVLAACGSGAPPTIPGAQLPVEWISVGGHRITAEIAVRPEERNRGLMFRGDLPPDHGMLFVFPEEHVLSFWMRNTTLPLSIAYANSRGRIVRIADLEPLDERPVTSMAPARYALEMNRGWFAKHAVSVGDRLADLPEIAR